MKPAELIQRRYSPLEEPRIILEREQERYEIVLVRAHVGARQQAEEDDDTIAGLGIVERLEELFRTRASGGGGGAGAEEVAEGFVEVVVAVSCASELLRQRERGRERTCPLRSLHGRARGADSPPCPELSPLPPEAQGSASPHTQTQTLRTASAPPSPTLTRDSHR